MRLPLSNEKTSKTWQVNNYFNIVHPFSSKNFKIFYTYPDMNDVSKQLPPYDVFCRFIDFIPHKYKATLDQKNLPFFPFPIIPHSCYLSLPFPNLGSSHLHFPKCISWKLRVIWISIDFLHEVSCYVQTLLLNLKDWVKRSSYNTCKYLKNCILI